MSALAKFLTLLALSGLLQGCLEDDDSAAQNEPQPTVTETPDTATTPQLVAVGPSADFSTGSHALIDTEAPYVSQHSLAADSGSDLTISAYKHYFYRIDRSGASIAKFALQAPETPIWQCSTGAFSNPYQVIHVNDERAYVLRYGAAELWEINPNIADSSACESGFKTAEIDLSGFDADGTPDMAAAVIVDNYLFVALQRLTFFTPVQESQVVVINTATNALVDTDASLNGLQAITLLGKNPLSLQYLASTDRVYVQSVGKYDSTAFGGTPAEYSGGIDRIDPTTFTVDQLLDDTAQTAQISALHIHNENLGFLVSYGGYKNNTLYAFDPQSGVIEEDSDGNLLAIAGLAGQNISGLLAGSGDQLWLLVDSGLTLLNSATRQIEAILIDTQMNPGAAVLVQP